MKSLREKTESLVDGIKAQAGDQGDSDNVRAFYAGIAEQERLGLEAYERERKALEEVQRRLDMNVRFLKNQLTEADMRDPGLKHLLNQRSAALSAALRRGSK